MTTWQEENTALAADPFMNELASRLFPDYENADLSSAQRVDYLRRASHWLEVTRHTVQ